MADICTCSADTAPVRQYVLALIYRMAKVGGIDDGTIEDKLSSIGHNQRGDIASCDYWSLLARRDKEDTRSEWLAIGSDFELWRGER